MFSLALISFLALFVELAFIRWLPSNILSLWYFSNIVLVSSFLGIGLGALIAKNGKDLFRWFPVVFLLVTCAVVALRWFEVIIPSEGGEWLWNFHYRGNVLSAFRFQLDIYSTLAIVFLLNTTLFIYIGHKIGVLMSKFRSETAYSIDLFGGFLGVATFTLLVMMGGIFATPTMWFSIIGLITLWFLWDQKKFFILGLICLGCAVALVFNTSKQATWSPYYSIQTKTVDNDSLNIYVNRFFYQQAVNFDTNQEAKWKYLLPYHFTKPKNVLILGAGSGNDVAVANFVGVPAVDAVEIDQEIYNLGFKKHPLSPYQNANVTVHIDDARSFLKKNDTKYDMIVLGTLDSHALLSAMSTVRLDNFVYTLDSLEEVKGHLSENGIAVLQFSAPNEEFGARLLSIAASAFSDVPKVAYWGNNTLFNVAFLAGPGVTEASIQSLDTNLFTRIKIPSAIKSADYPTDDWPYLYLKGKSVPGPYIKAIAVLLGISIVYIFFFLRKRKEVLTFVGLNFFLLGAAFLLIETKSITSLSLLYGSTWIVNAFVFGSILFMLFVANLFVIKKDVKQIRYVYIALGVSLLINYFLPIGYFLHFGYVFKSLLSTFFLTLPIFFSAIIFSYTFKRVSGNQTSSMYGMNLAGAVFGGLLEYGSMLVGLKALYIIAFLLYGFSYILLQKDSL